MKKYLHKNKSHSEVFVVDVMGERYPLKPNEEILLSHKYEKNGVKVIEKKHKKIEKEFIEEKKDEM